jgi:outer membrane immunogenic protein
VQARIKFSLTLLAVMAVSGVLAHGQKPTTAAAPPPRAEIALDYTYMRSNAPPGECSCFNLTGGSGTFAWRFTRNFSAVGDVTVTHSNDVSYTGQDLTLSAYTAGLRYTKHLGQLHPFGQVLAGVAHASGSLATGSTGTISNAGAAFASNIGGGVDYDFSRHFGVRIIDADYLLTTFDNGSNDHQNNLRLSAGVVIHF